MSSRGTSVGAMAAPLDGFTASEVTYNGVTKTVYRAGSGPGVIVMAEIPGITPAVAGFARRVVDAGFTVAMPSLFGSPGKERSLPYALSSLTRACVSREFACLAAGRTSPVVSWLRELAADVHRDCGGPGVGAIGMCLTGGFALAMMVEPAVVAPVLSQPSLPLPLGGRRQGDLGLDADDLAIARERAASEPCPVLGLRFTGDLMVRPARFDALRRELGEQFVAVEIDSSPDNEHGIPRSAHSVVTEDLVDTEGHPTRHALDQVLGFFADRLRS